MKYAFEGPGPVVDPQGEIVHPNDVVEAAEEPTWSGPFRLLDEPEEAEPEPPADAAASHLAVTPPELAAQGILARDLKGM